MRRQYCLRPSKRGFFAWDVHRLIALAKDLPVFDKPVAQSAELDEPHWFRADTPPTVRDIIDHVRLIEETNLRYPILLCADGRVMDGMHRIAKAVLAGRSSVKARQFRTTPPPDFTDVDPDELSYD